MMRMRAILKLGSESRREFRYERMVNQSRLQHHALFRVGTIIRGLANQPGEPVHKPAHDQGERHDFQRSKSEHECLPFRREGVKPIVTSAADDARQISGARSKRARSARAVRSWLT